MLHEFLTNPTIYNPQIDYLLFLQNHRIPALDYLFTNITLLGAGVKTYIFICICYWLINKNVGFMLLNAMQFGLYIKDVLKATAYVDRPWVMSDKIHPIESTIPAAVGYSYPSGHTLRGIVAIAGLSLATWKNKIATSLFIILGLLVAFSRNYVGVHTPQDVITGLFIAIIALYLSKIFFDWIGKKENGALIYLVSVLVLFFVFAILKYLHVYAIAWINYFDSLVVLLSTVFGYFVDRKFIKYEIPQTKWYNKVLIGIIGILGLFLIEYLSLKLINLFSFNHYKYMILYSNVTLYITIIYPIFVKLFSKKLKV